LSRGENKSKELLEELKEYKRMLEQHSKKLEEILEKLKSLLAKYNSLFLGINSLVKSFYSRFVWEDIRAEITSEGGRVIRRERDARINDIRVDFLVETLRKVYIVDVRIEPKISDVGELLAKTSILSRKYPGKLIIPILAGAVIEENIENYAKSRGIRVYKL